MEDYTILELAWQHHTRVTVMLKLYLCLIKYHALRCTSCLVKHHALKTYWGTESIAPRINLGPRWRWVVSFMPWPHYHQCKSPRYPLERRLGGSQSRSGCCGKENFYYCHCQELNPSCPACSLVSILTNCPGFYATLLYYKFHSLTHLLRLNLMYRW
jgi:hypothetical protein